MRDSRTYLQHLSAGTGVAFLAGCVDEDAATDDDNESGSSGEDTGDGQSNDE